MATVHDRAMEKMKTMDTELVGGVAYLNYKNVESASKQMELIRNVHMRESDVIAVGFPRSGNHWAYEVLNLVVHETSNFVEGVFYKQLFEHMGNSIHEAFAQIESPRVLCTHQRIYRIPSQAVGKKVKIVYLLRNPKDILISLYRLMSRATSDWYKFTGSWAEFLELHLTGDFVWGTWFDHVLATEKFMKEHPDIPVYIHVYEEMKQDPVGKIKALCSFLGKSDTLAEEMANTVEFNNMKTTLLQGKLKPMIDNHFQDKDTLFKSGVVGAWKSEFTVAQSERFDRLFNEKMSGSRLGLLVEKYL